MADVEDGEETCALASHSGSSGSKSGGDKMFSLKKWNAVAMWSWDVECDTCAICRVQVMDACLRCQAENKQEDCVAKPQSCHLTKPCLCYTPASEGRGGTVTKQR
ncbi:RING-box protein 2 isoform X2 [Hylobates moloch]|uniref:RING-box protein 2 isoform X2 n=1 Tax=Hylobates moloch TaxID=81572 RepID=UPI0013633B1B|nr:RING-box protein 2 isoform X2 [Hylobates moloch]